MGKDILCFEAESSVELERRERAASRPRPHLISRHARAAPRALRYWPALLMAAGLEPPTRLFAHGWWTRDGSKISKSVGNVIDPNALVETFGVDAVSAAAALDSPPPPPCCGAPSNGTSRKNEAAPLPSRLRHPVGAPSFPCA